MKLSEVVAHVTRKIPNSVVDRHEESGSDSPCQCDDCCPSGYETEPTADEDCGMSSSSASVEARDQDSKEAQYHDEDINSVDDEYEASADDPQLSSSDLDSVAVASRSAKYQPQRNPKRGVPEIGGVFLANGYEKIMLVDGGFKRRRVGAKKWQRYCAHERRRDQCKICARTLLCKHLRARTLCKKCNDAGLMCEHGCQRAECRICEPKSFCEHNRERSKCDACRTQKSSQASYCDHGRVYDQCHECRPSLICRHDRHLAHCGTCRVETWNGLEYGSDSSPEGSPY